MIDPIAAHLFFLLQKQTSVSTVDLCWFDEQRAEEVMVSARMYQHAPGMWATTALTAAFVKRMHAEIVAIPEAVRKATDAI